MDIFKVIINSVVAFIFLFIVAKVMGKKQIAQLDFIDYIIGISLGSIAAQMAYDTEIPYYYFLIAMAIFTILDMAMTLLGRKATFFKKIIVGSPVIFIKDGKLMYQNIKKTKLTINEFLSLCREQGYFNINDIAYCFFETSGKLSVLPKSEVMPVVAKDLNVKLSKSSLTYDVIIDGVIVNDALKELNKNKNWLFDNLNIQDKDALKDIALAFYDEDKNKFYVHPKELPENN